MSKTSGFTIIELMVTVAVAAILATVALPSFSNFIAAQRVDASARNINSALMLTRSEAIKRNASVYLSAGTGFGNSLLVTTNSSRTLAECSVATAPADCVKVIQLSSAVNISVDPVGTSQITYNRAGRANTGIKLTLCPGTAGPVVKQRLITIGTTGLPDISHGSDC